MRFRLLAAFGLAVSFAAIASAQPPKATDSKGIKASLEWTAADRDFTGEGQMVLDGLLHEGRSATQDFDVKAGETYLVAGACDTHCKSMGMRVTDAAGTVLIESKTAGDAPALVFKTTKAQTITVATAMADCSAKAGCAYGFVLIESGGTAGETGSAAAADPMQLDAVRTLVLDRGKQNNFKSESKVQTGVLREGESVRLSLDIDPAKSHAIIAKCDAHCGNLDLHGYDPKGAEFVKDTDTDAAPVLLIAKAQSGAKVDVKLDMVTCEAKSCVYAVGVFTRD